MQSTLADTALLQNFIGGRAVAAHGEGRMDLIDPVTEQVYGQAPISDQSDVDAAYAAAGLGGAVVDARFLERRCVEHSRLVRRRHAFLSVVSGHNKIPDPDGSENHFS